MICDTVPIQAGSELGDPRTKGNKPQRDSGQSKEIDFLDYFIFKSFWKNESRRASVTSTSLTKYGSFNFFKIHPYCQKCKYWVSILEILKTITAPSCHIKAKRDTEVPQRPLGLVVQSLERREQPDTNFDVLKPLQKCDLICQEGRHDRRPKGFFVAVINLKY